MQTLANLSTTLSAASVNRFYNPFADFEWPAQLQDDKLAFAPALSTLNFLPDAETFNAEQTKQFLFLECVNFFSLNITGEKALMGGIAERLHSGYADEVSHYLHHFMDEENKHMSVFAHFCKRYGKRIYITKNLPSSGQQAAGVADVLFFGRIVIFEQIADHYNKAMMADPTLDDTVQRIHRMHHQDETRHLAFGRSLLADLHAQHAQNWHSDTCAFVSNYLTDYAEAAWREYFNPYFMRDAGIDDAYTKSRAAFASEAARAYRNAVNTPWREHFLAHGIVAQ